MGPQPAGTGCAGEVKSDMVKFGPHYASVARIWRAGAVATALTLGVTGLSAVGYAQQQPAAKKAPEKAPAAAAKRLLPKRPQSAWVKLCEAGQTVSKDKDGKEEKQDLKICMTITSASTATRAWRSCRLRCGRSKARTSSISW